MTAEAGIDPEMNLTLDLKCYSLSALDAAFQTPLYNNFLFVLFFTNTSLSADGFNSNIKSRLDNAIE